MIQYTGPKADRNEKCPCGSGLKYKHCHGDAGKVAICNRVANEKMVQLIAEEKERCEQKQKEGEQNEKGRV